MLTTIGVKDFLRILYFVVGIWIVFDIKNCKNYFKHSCDMTVMHRMPILLPVHNDYESNYRMFIYGEGEYIRKIKNTKEYDGIPIVYVPGNRAPADMVRSIGSILQNKTEMNKVPFHFNVFSAHLNEEPSTFDVKTLKKHALYLIKSLKYVDKLYENRKHKFVIIGHSISGIAIKIALSQSQWLRENTAFIITLGTAFKEHQFKITGDFIDLWREMHTMVEIPIISIHGGLMDENAEESFTGNEGGYSYSTQIIDRVWTMSDHNCLVWCNQLQRSISRLLFEYAEDKNNKFSRNNIDKILDKIFNSTSFIYPIIEKKSISNNLIQIDINNKSEQLFLYVIRKTNKNIAPLYETQYTTQLTPKKDFFYDKNMKYTYSLEYIRNQSQYYIDKDAHFDIVSKNEITILRSSLSITTIKFLEKKNIKIFVIPFISPNIVYRITVTKNKNPLPKLYFKSNLNAAISQNGMLLFNYFDETDNEDGKLFIMSQPGISNDNNFIEINMNIEIGLTVIRVIKLNITNVPYILSFIAFLFSFKSNDLGKFLIFNFVILYITGSFITTFIMVFLAFIIMYFIELFLLILTLIGKILNIRRISIRGYKWIYKNIISTKLLSILSFSSLVYQPAFLLFSVISFLISPSLLLFITSIILHLPIYFTFYELPRTSLEFSGLRLYEISVILTFLVIYKLKNNKILISSNPWIAVIPYFFLLTLGVTYFDVWEYVVFTQTLSILLLKMIKEK
ncbi:GPI inositol-deacylase [Strongyloides ratti]|uniref:GPI inositol-deacylase n=1 Tax=Strongyloides ratti TaxID=34506 RepID=A0A090LC38_STRRB|nr:GPI inositol-deacylase [Strongyloides ratti]CEF65095.1 GPI inositol-deacylase [Strongyloides ratti]